MSRGLCFQAKQCHYDNAPFFGYNCNHIKHEVDHCLRDDYRLRMMEYERERRLRQRAKRIDAAGAAEDMDE